MDLLNTLDDKKAHVHTAVLLQSLVSGHLEEKPLRDCLRCAVIWMWFGCGPQRHKCQKLSPLWVRLRSCGGWGGWLTSLRGGT
jgi:hypothetical protein